ncbi:MAG TPA: nucleotidyltransferase family protein [Lacipirellula sp.]
MDMPAATKSDVVERLKAQSSTLRDAGVRRIGLFGSFVTNQSTDDSDVDLLVEFEPHRKSFDTFIQLAELLETQLQRPVDLITKESLSPYIGPRILAEVEYVPLGE